MVDVDCALTVNLSDTRAEGEARPHKCIIVEDVGHQSTIDNGGEGGGGRILI